jgi:hypothetical protein
MEVLSARTIHYLIISFIINQRERDLAGIPEKHMRMLASQAKKSSKMRLTGSKCIVTVTNKLD